MADDSQSTSEHAQPPPPAEIDKKYESFDGQGKFILYLLGHPVFPEGMEGLPNELDIPTFETHIEKLDTHRPVRKQTSEEDIIRLGNPSGLFAEEIDALRKSESEIEASSAVYYASPSEGKPGRIDMVDIHDGTHGSTTSQVNEVYRAGHAILFGMHTHDGPSLPSANSDYDYLLIGDTSTGERVERATMVLCPGHQILAVASSDTPIVDIDNIDEFTGEYDKEFGVVEQKARLARRSELIMKIAQREMMKAKDETDAENKAKKALRISDKASDRHMAEMDKRIDAANRQFPKRHGIKLYRSTDRRHFVAFDPEVEAETVQGESPQELPQQV